MITFNIIIYLIVQPYLQVPVFQVPALTVFHLCTPKDTNLYYIRIYLSVNSGGTFFFSYVHVKISCHRYYFIAYYEKTY